MFQLEHAIALWRCSYDHTPAFQGDDLEELEAHLRDHIEALIDAGYTPQAAFDEAMQDLGDYGSTEVEYRKVFWDKLHHQHHFLDLLKWGVAMLGNYLKTALRNLRRHKGFTLINITGLTVGITSCLLIALYVQHEYSYDGFHENADRIYRVAVDLQTSSGVRPLAQTGPPVAPNLEREFPEVERAVRLRRASFLVGRPDEPDRNDQETGILYADAGVFDMFSFEFLYGTPDHALVDPNTMVLTESAARKYFGDENPVGRTLVFDREQSFTVTGVVRDVPTNSHFTFDFLLSHITWTQTYPQFEQEWFFFVGHTYVLLPESHQAADFEAQLPDFVGRHLDWSEEADGPIPFTLVLEPLMDIYLHSERRGQIGPSGDAAALEVFMLIALIILVIACVNFMNLATARSSVRAREVGVRKSIGAQRLQLVFQFLVEAVLIAGLAFGLALGLAFVSLPLFEWLSGKTILALLLFQPAVLGAMIGISLLVGLLAGSYPALVLSGFKPMTVLKGRLSSSGRGGLLRKGLVVFQFCISVALIAGAGVVGAQVDFMQDRDLGFEKDRMLIVNSRRDPVVQQNMEPLREAWLKNPAVEAVTVSNRIPGSGNLSGGVSMENSDGEMQGSILYHYSVGYDFISTYGLEVVAGRAFSTDFGTDAEAAFMVNEAAAAHFGYASASAVVGKPFAIGEQTGTVIGVVKDFNTESLHQPVHPLVLYIGPEQAGYISVRLNTGQLLQTMTNLEATWKQLVPHRPFDYSFLDASFKQQYEADVRFGRLFDLFSGLAIVIACLGLFGLSTFTVQQRTKEIGVRKVMGASVTGIVVLLSRGFVKLVGFAFVLAVPVVYLAMSRWLEGFAYHIEISGWIFLFSGLATLLMAVFTVSYQSIRAARANPVDALRYE